VQVLDLPYLLRDDRIAEAVLSEGTFTRALREQMLADSGGMIRLMTIGNTGGWRNFANTKREIRSPADMEGLKIRTVVADLPQELVRAMGAAPTPIPWPELFTSFQTGVVEGSKNGITDIMGMKFPDAGLKYLTLDGHSYMGALWYMNNDRFMGLPEDLRRVVVDGFAASAGDLRLAEAQVDPGLQGICRSRRCRLRADDGREGPVQGSRSPGFRVVQGQC
jgi:TRAP-type C4-dicarboxylate transport system substrate-binding protein